MIYSFNNDYSEGAHPRILQAMMETNLEQNNGYSLDLHTDHAKELIRQEIGREDADIHMITGGTQTNLLAISCALKPYQAVICAETGHINVHETGAIEATGHKVLGQPTPDGLMTPALIQKALDWHTDEHMVQPKMVYISNATEVGTQYTKAQLEALSAFCRQKGLYLFFRRSQTGFCPYQPCRRSDTCGHCPPDGFILHWRYKKRRPFRRSPDHPKPGFKAGFPFPHQTEGRHAGKRMASWYPV